MFVYNSWVSITSCKLDIADILNVCCIPEEIHKEQVVILSSGETVNSQDAQDLPYQEPAAYATAAAVGEPEKIGRNCWKQWWRWHVRTYATRIPIITIWKCAQRAQCARRARLAQCALSTAVPDSSETRKQHRYVTARSPTLPLIVLTCVEVKDDCMHAMKAHGRVEAQLLPVWNYAPHGGKCSVWRSDRFTSREIVPGTLWIRGCVGHRPDLDF